MAGMRKPGPLCGYSNPVNVDDGTMCRAESPQPGFVSSGFVPRSPGTYESKKRPGSGRGSIKVTEQMVREVMKDAPYTSQQKNGVSLPILQEFVDRLLEGEKAPAIKVDGNMLVDGNHRYIAARILGEMPEIQPWLGARPADAISWDRIPIDLKRW